MLPANSIRVHAPARTRIRGQPDASAPPFGDDAGFARALDREGVLVLPGTMFETPGYFRICLTAAMDAVEAAIPRFAAAFAAAG